MAAIQQKSVGEEEIEIYLFNGGEDAFITVKSGKHHLHEIDAEKVVVGRLQTVGSGTFEDGGELGNVFEKPAFGAPYRVKVMPFVKTSHEKGAAQHIATAKARLVGNRPVQPLTEVGPRLLAGQIAGIIGGHKHIRAAPLADQQAGKDEKMPT